VVLDEGADTKDGTATIVVLGTVVGFIVSAIFLPLYTLIGNIK